ncbi:MAG: undecaprenyl-diphosphate phosphatase [Fibromonadaceae bacterium]|jgi:undecaprenyl-diphosphatase|nr:undecaprenyl-diphosphate phosphatase [Fibromonadaceae bacterium]
MLDAIIIGLVQGLTEFLPISSTGHMLIANSFLKSDFNDAFYVLVQVGPIAACALVFWKDISGFFINRKEPATKDYVLKLSAAFFLTGIGGFIAKMCGIKLPETILPVALALLIGGLIIFAVEYNKKRDLKADLTWAVVVAVAIGQMVAAIFPGASRSGMAIMAALIVGLARPQAVKFSFLVGIPTMFAAGSYELFREIKNGNATDLFSLEAIVAYIIATISAWLTVVWLLKFVQTRNFVPFAWYRTGMGIILLVLFAFGVIN